MEKGMEITPKGQKNDYNQPFILIEIPHSQRLINFTNINIDGCYSSVPVHDAVCFFLDKQNEV